MTSFRRKLWFLPMLLALFLILIPVVVATAAIPDPAFKAVNGTAVDIQFLLDNGLTMAQIKALDYYAPVVEMLLKTGQINKDQVLTLVEGLLAHRSVEAEPLKEGPAPFPPPSPRSAAGEPSTGPLKFVINNSLLEPDVTPRIINGRVMVPARWLAEALGARVEWEEATRTIKIDDPESDSLRRQLTLLEKALTPESPGEAVQSWAAGVKNRNGAWQYALLAPALKEKCRPDYERMGWVTGVSSPWVEKYTILEQKEEPEGSWRFTVQFDLMTSTGPAGSYINHVTVQHQDGSWYITGIDSTWDQWQLKVQLQKQVEDLIARQYQHYRVLDTKIDLQSFYQSGFQAEAVYLVRVSHLLGVDTPAEWPPQKGRLHYLDENRARLTPEALRKIERQIAFWQQELQEYITEPQEANEFLKVTARFDSRGRLQKDSVQFFIEDAVGQYIPLDMNLPYFKSEAELIQQGYEEMRQLAAGAG
ncbi:copper amine oxidase N-terminal domain-containing protein [Neomoorella humiferrea]|uniref:copper amine oxidase N-terminal domain-containing protein n=1 Tax=Neomoorella humiferrea TaxID=676965 RepID=UPI003D92CFE5